MDPVKHLYEVQVAGLPLKLRSSHDEATVNSLINIVDSKLKEAMGTGNSVSFQNALLLTALHLAEDLLLLKRVSLEELEGLEGRAQQILTELEDSPVSQLRLDN